MNKTKRVAWHKHLKQAKKRREKARAQAAGPTTAPSSAPTTQRPAAPRR